MMGNSGVRRKRKPCVPGVVSVEPGSSIVASKHASSICMRSLCSAVQYSNVAMPAYAPLDNGFLALLTGALQAMASARIGCAQSGGTERN